MKPPVGSAAHGLLTGEQVRGIFLVTVLLIPADRIRRQRGVVVATMNRLVWAAAAPGATAFLVALAFTGGRSGPGSSRSSQRD